MGVEQQQERVVDHRPALRRRLVELLAVEEHPDHVAVPPLPVALGHLAPVRPEPPGVGQAARAVGGALEEAHPAEHRVAAAQPDQPAGEEVELGLPRLVPPTQPRQLVVLAPRVVVAVLRAAELVAPQDHRHALRQEQRGQEVALLAPAQGEDLRIVGRPFDAAVPRPVVVGPVLVALLIGLVVLLVVGDEVAQGEAVVGGDEVDRRERVAPVPLIEVARPGEPARKVGHARLTAPEVADHVAVDAVPLRPQDREVPDLVAARADVPRLGDELDLGEDRILVDHVEERRQPVDVVELPGQRARQVEAEAVDVALADEVPQRVHDQPQHARVHRVQAVARPREVHVVARVVRHQAVVGLVVDPLEGERRPEVVALGRVVVDHVHDHLDARPVERLDHALELAHLLAVLPRGRVQRVGCEEADRAVAPVVGQAPLGQEALVDDRVDREQLDRRHPEILQVGDGRLAGQARVGPAEILAHGRVQPGEALDVGLVDDRLVPRPPRRPVALPVEAGVDDHAARHGRRRVLVVELEVGVRVLGVGDVGQGVGLVPGHRPVDRLGVRVEQELVRVEAVPVLRRERPVDAVAVALPRADPRQVAVPVVGRAVGELDPVLVAGLVEQAELGQLRVLGEDREVRAPPVPRRPERERVAEPDLGHPSSAPASGSSRTAPS